MNTKTRSTLYLILTAALWGTSFVAFSVGSSYLGALTYTAARFLLGTLSMIPVILLFERKRPTPAQLRATLRGGLLTGLVLAAAALTQQYGVALTGSAGISGFITNLYTVITPILCFLLFRQNPGKFAWMGFALAFAGLYLLSGARGFSIGLGEGMLMLSAVLWSSHMLMIDRTAREALPLRFAMLTFLVAAVLSTLGAVCFETVTLAALGQAKYAILYGGLISVGAAYTFQVLGQRDADPSFAALIFCLEPVFAALGGALVLQEVLGVRSYVGCGLIFAGILLSRVRSKSKPQAQSPEDVPVA